MGSMVVNQYALFMWSYLIVRCRFSADSITFSAVKSSMPMLKPDASSDSLEQTIGT